MFVAIEGFVDMRQGLLALGAASSCDLPFVGVCLVWTEYALASTQTASRMVVVLGMRLVLPQWAAATALEG